MDIHIFRDHDALDEHAANIITQQLLSVPESVLGMATGSTPIGLYNKLTEKHAAGQISFRQAFTFNLDEYVGLEKSHSQSYYEYMQKHLFRHIDIPTEHIRFPNGMAEDLEQECQRYNKMLAEQPIDVQLLGLGHNGHIGFNEPDEELVQETHVVQLEPSTRQANARFFESMDEVPTHAITMGVGSILKAKHILLIVKGEDKADIVYQALKGPITTQCPASLLQTHPRLTVFLDEQAGRRLQ
ncbi:glucosamine-6-phosphate deaminase [Marinicrinis lubricantis]|uniref:Glucosamine-6-phosphate deaminase n=1 Tax=Marinicrinis lubricantis TaxID=2086470 RepID=A0ABW1IKU8_9BACL